MNIPPPPDTPFESIDTPALILELDALNSNIETIHGFFRGRPCRVRSVTKSHKCPAIAQLPMAADGAVPLGLCGTNVSKA